MDDIKSNTINITEEEMFDIVIPLDSEVENIISISQSEPDLS